MSVLRVVLQSVERASLLVNNVDKWVDVGRGVVVYISFLKGANKEAAAKAATDIVNAKVFPRVDPELNRGRAARVSDEGWDVLIVPQATLAGKIKSKQGQYHSQCDKEEGAGLYEYFCEEIAQLVARGHEKRVSAGDGAEVVPPSVKCGTYGNRQGLRFESLGPFTHSLEY